MSTSARFGTPAVQKKVFMPDALPTEKVFGIEVVGEPDEGKTHVAATFPKALFLDTEHKANIVLEKFKDKGHFWKKVDVWEEIREGVDWALTQPSIKTIVIDSGADIQELAVSHWSKGHGGKKPIVMIGEGVSTILYAQVYELIDTLVTDVLDSGRYLVVTCRLKDEYVSNTNTGRRIRQGYKKFPWSLTLGVRFVDGIYDPRTGKSYFKHFRFGEVIKNNYWGIDVKKGVTCMKPYIFDISFEGFNEEMVKPWHGVNGVPLKNRWDMILQEAGDYLKAMGLE
uniref:Putative ATPase domain containing protein n=1 Tax=viral metagenome TaxID=1070528 RepID=A0A6M3J9X9_9ZZZZ